MKDNFWFNFYPTGLKENCCDFSWFTNMFILGVTIVSSIVIVFYDIFVPRSCLLNFYHAIGQKY